MKLAGEVAVQRSVRKDSWAIVRIPILYGRVERLDESPVTEIAIKVAQRTPFKIDDWASRYPAHADDVAGAIALIAAELLKGKGGVYHFAGAECLTKYRMARIIAEALGIDSSFVEPDPNPPPGAPRPKDCRLDGSSLENLGFKRAIPFADGVREALMPFFKL
jgi:dTDP-4-dehydrorhamnose reductase